MTVVRPFTYESDEDMTLADLEAFCRNARTAGGTDDDQLRCRTHWRGGVRALRLKITLAHNRQAAHRKDQSR